jgi:hypothetical protein
LSRRDPTQAGGEHDGEGEIGRIEQVLLLPTKDELTADGDDRGQCRDGEVIGAEQDAERQGRDEGALRIKAWKLGVTCSGILCEQRCSDRDGDLPEAQVEVEPEETVDQQRSQTGDLIEAGIAPVSRWVRLGCALDVLHVSSLQRRVWGDGGNPFRR